MSQGLFDFTLFTRNATLLKHLIDQGSDQSSYFYFLVPLITIALIVQVLIYASKASKTQKITWFFQGTSGVLQLIMAKWNFNQKGGKTTLNKLNNVSVILVFITSALNVIINIFAIPDSKPNKLDWFVIFLIIFIQYWHKRQLNWNNGGNGRRMATSILTILNQKNSFLDCLRNKMNVWKLDSHDLINGDSTRTAWVGPWVGQRKVKVSQRAKTMHGVRAWCVSENRMIFV